MIGLVFEESLLPTTAMVERAKITIGDTSECEISERIVAMLSMSVFLRGRSGSNRWRAMAGFVLGSLLLVASAGAVPASATAHDGGEHDGEEKAPVPLSELPSAIPEGVRDSIVRLYGAVFDRNPDAAGFDYWLGLYLSGTPLTAIAEAFMESPEWTDTYGEVGDDQFVDLLYQNVLDRRPDEDGAAHWRAQLANGLSRVDMLLGFSESSEYIAVTGTAPPEAPRTFPTLPADSGSGRRIVYSNSEQRVWWVDASERVVESYAVSGRKGVPTPGTYSVFSKSPVAWAGHDGITMNHMVRFARGETLAIGFHSIPRYADGRPLQTEDELGGYRSAGCVRQADHNAEALYNWAEVGTTVVVLG